MKVADQNTVRPRVADCKILNIDSVEDRRGSLSIVGHGSNVPFDVKRVFYLYDIPSGKSRGEHAHRTCHQFLVAVSGGFRIRLDDGVQSKVVELRRPSRGLYIPPGIWAGEKDFSGGSVCLVLTSHKYDADDYIRDYGTFLEYRANQ